MKNVVVYIKQVQTLSINENFTIFFFCIRLWMGVNFDKITTRNNKVKMRYVLYIFNASLRLHLLNSPVVVNYY